MAAKPLRSRRSQGRGHKVAQPRRDAFGVVLEFPGTAGMLAATRFELLGPSMQGNLPMAMSGASTSQSAFGSQLPPVGGIRGHDTLPPIW